MERMSEMDFRICLALMELVAFDHDEYAKRALKSFLAKYKISFKEFSEFWYE